MNFNLIEKAKLQNFWMIALSKLMASEMMEVKARSNTLLMESSTARPASVIFSNVQSLS